MKVDKDMIITDMLEMDDAVAPLLMAMGMHCISCFAAQGETLEEACFVHGMDADRVVNQINEYLEKKEALNA